MPPRKAGKGPEIATPGKLGQHTPGELRIKLASDDIISGTRATIEYDDPTLSRDSVPQVALDHALAAAETVRIELGAALRRIEKICFDKLESDNFELLLECSSVGTESTDSPAARFAIALEYDGILDSELSRSLAMALYRAASHPDADEALSKLKRVMDRFDPNDDHSTDRGGAQAGSEPPMPEVRYVPIRVKNSRIDPKRRASAFLVKHWKDWLDRGLLTQARLKHIDPDLKRALDNEFQGRRAELRILLPIKTDEVNRRLMEIIGKPLEGDGRRRVVKVLGQLEPGK